MPTYNVKLNRPTRLAVSTYIESKELHGQSLAETLTDLLTDLMQFAAARAVDFKGCLISAGMHYKAETGGSDFDSFSDHATYKTDLWLNNDQPTYKHWTARAHAIRNTASEIAQVKDGTWTTQNAIAYTLADEIEAEVREGLPDLESSIYSDLISAALDEVSWLDIAVTFTDAMEE